MRYARVQSTEGPVVCQVDPSGRRVAVRFSDTGRPVRDLHDVILAGPSAADRLTTDDGEVDGQLLAPIVPQRNVFCVGRNYSEHAAEFARSGFDAGSDADDHLPTHPVVFTKPAAAVIASGTPIDPHSDITSALDYEGEVGVIIGKRASKVSAADAMEHVWGYALVNDVTARDLQKNHKQWFIGKSLDTFCPMGPWAVSRDEIDLDDLQLQTRVNGELRQDANTSDLIFDVPTIIETLSAGITLHPGDVIATGTPVGVGIGLDPPTFLADGDEVVISAPGLGELRNVVGLPRTGPGGSPRVGDEVFVEVTGTGPTVVLIHGLGGTTNVYEPQVAALAEAFRVVRYDLSGHGRSPMTSQVSIDGWVDELEAIVDAQGPGRVSLVAHSLGTLVATHFAQRHPERVDRLALLGAVRTPSDAAAASTRARAELVRTGGMEAIADTLVAASLAPGSRERRPTAVGFVRELLLRQDPAGYAAACDALAGAHEADLRSITAPVMLLTGSDDHVSPSAVNRDLAAIFPHASLHVLPDVGHWHTVEAPGEVTRLLLDFLVDS